jgi:hypothetical protein
MRLPSAESWFIFETMLARKSNRPWQEELDATLCDNLPATDAIYQRFAGIGGSAYFVGGLGMTALTMNDIVVVPIRTGWGYGWARMSAISNSRRRRPGTRSELDMNSRRFTRLHRRRGRAASAEYRVRGFSQC